MPATPWDGVHSAWASAIAARLNRDLLPADYFAMPQVTVGGRVQIDLTHLDSYEVKVMHQIHGPRLRAAIELVSPANKDRPGHRRAFAIKCAAYLQEGVSLVVVDIVTERLANLHLELMNRLALEDDLAWSSPSDLYAITYRATNAAPEVRLEVWPEALALDQNLPTMPLWLEDDLVIPLDLEETYTTTCGSLRIPI